MPPVGRPGAPTSFDDALFAADLDRASDRGRELLVGARARMEREGVMAHERRSCATGHPSGTDLPGCVKVYVPDMAGRWRMVFRVARLADGHLGLVYLASGVAHLPRDSRRRDVYELAHYRLHGAWPARPR